MALRIGRCLLPQLIQKTGMTQTEFAHRIGINETTMSLYVNNKRIMSIENAKIIASALGVHIDDLYEWHGSVRLRGRE